jgi:transporter family-2 protein
MAMSLQGLLLTLAALVGGGLIALQAPINAEAASRLGNPLAAATMSFCVGTAALILVTMLVARHSTDLGTVKGLPLYMLLGGGLLCAVYVTVNLILAPRIGVAAVMALGIAGQLFAALLVDRLGLFELMERGLTAGRVGGAVLVVVGALMVRLL